VEGSIPWFFDDGIIENRVPVSSHAIGTRDSASEEF